MSEENKQVKESTVLHKQDQKPTQDQFSAPTWALIFVLIAVFVVLKSFIYIKDEKRDGK